MIPPYTVRRSLRAKYPRIVINTKCGTPRLEVVLPRRFDDAGVPSFLNQHKEWIKKTWDAQTKQAEEAKILRVLPGEIALAAVGEIWTVSRDVSIPPLRLIWDERILKISPGNNDENAVSLLKEWLNRKAKFHLVPIVQAIAKEFGFGELRDVRVRCQKTLWGSCSKSGDISLNCKLLFLPPPLVRHILLHELCHLREMNHSKKFYDILNKLDLNAEKNSALVRNQWDYVPRWMEIE